MDAQSLPVQMCCSSTTPTSWTPQLTIKYIRQNPLQQKSGKTSRSNETNPNCPCTHIEQHDYKSFNQLLRHLILRRSMSTTSKSCTCAHVQHANQHRPWPRCRHQRAHMCVLAPSKCPNLRTILLTRCGENLRVLFCHGTEWMTFSSN